MTRRSENDFRKSLFASIERFTAERYAGAQQEEACINKSVAESGEPDKPFDGTEVVDDEIADVEKFEVRNGEVDRIDNGLRRFAQLQSDFAEMPAKEKDS